MSAAPKLELVPQDDEMEMLRAEAKALRDALREKDRAYDFIEGVCQNLTRHIVKLHEQFTERQDAMQRQMNEIALAASLVPSLQERIAEVGRVADRSAQLLTVLAERVDGIAARETL
jgi:capsid protein